MAKSPAADARDADVLPLASEKSAVDLWKNMFYTY
jgi:hypothetical protein